MKVAIVHDWLIGGGAERVVDQLHQMYPEAPIYTSYSTQRWRDKLDDKVVTGFLQYWPFSKLRKFVPFLRAFWFSRLNLKNYDLVISSSGAEAKGVKRLKDSAMHISYIHAPTHYYWNRYDDYLKNPGHGRLDPLARFGLKLLVGPMRKWDYKAAQRPHRIITNSNYTKSQIKKYYGRDSVVIHPPVDVERFAIPHLKHDLPNVRKGFVIIGRQTPYKRVDLAVEACTQLNKILFVIGNGPENRKLRKIAGKSVIFLRKVTDEEMPHYLQSAEAFLFPGVDDFGIAAIEALAAGTPVIAYKDGGALDYVAEGKTGLFFDKQTSASLIETIQKFQVTKFNESTIKEAAAQFSPKVFKQKMKEVIKP